MHIRSLFQNHLFLREYANALYLPNDFFRFLTSDGVIYYSHTNLSIQKCFFASQLIGDCIVCVGLNIGLQNPCWSSLSTNSLILDYAWLYHERAN